MFLQNVVSSFVCNLHLKKMMFSYQLVRTYDTVPLCAVQSAAV